VLSKE